MTPESGSPYDPVLLRRHLAQAAAALPGPDYYEVLRWIHRILRPATYVEIGVRQGGSLQAALPHTTCVAMDPNPQLPAPAASNWRIFAMTSDQFFERHDVAQALGAPQFDLAFIDGLHLFEQALRDFIHLERYARPDSIILIHDCLPLDELTSERTRTTHFYSGDIWKLAVCLKRQRPDLKMATVRAGPTGLCLVSGLDASNTVLSRLGGQVQYYTALGYEDYRGHPEWLPETVENSYDAVDALLRAWRGGQAAGGTP